MPYTQKQRRAAFAELDKRRKGGGGTMFKGMSAADLEDYAESDLETKGGGKRRNSAGRQGDALKAR